MALEADVLFCSEIDFQQWYTFTCRENCKTIVEVDSVQRSENRVEVPKYTNCYIDCLHNQQPIDVVMKDANGDSKSKTRPRLCVYCSEWGGSGFFFFLILKIYFWEFQALSDRPVQRANRRPGREWGQ